MPTTPNAAQNISVRNQPASKPGMRPAGTRQGQTPPRGAQATAFAQALTQAQATRRGAGLAAQAGLPPGLGAGLGVGTGTGDGMEQGLGAGAPLAQQLANIQMMAQRATPVPAAAAAATKPAPPPAVVRPTLDLPGDFGAIVDQAAKKYGVDPALIAAVMQTESNFNPDAVSRAGARGLMQLMPATARGLGVTDAHDPVQAVMGGAKMLGQLLEKYNGKTDLALAAYNAGSGAVDKFGGIPPYDETRKYVPLVLGAYERFRQQAGTSATPTAGR